LVSRYECSFEWSGALKREIIEESILDGNNPIFFVIHYIIVCKCLSWFEVFFLKATKLDV
jgi:hypothetical protein